MTGPRVVRIEAPERPATRQRRVCAPSGIRLDNTGQWCAIRNGVLAGSYGGGANGRRLAIREAGSSVEV
jgi:hypothetical protein